MFRKSRKKKPILLRNYIIYVGIPVVLLCYFTLMNLENLVPGKPSWNDNSPNYQEQESSSSNYHRDNDDSRFRLANEQSLGFFDDISEDQWKRAQYIHAKLFPNHSPNLVQYANGPKDKGKLAQLKRSSSWNGQNFQVEFHCPLAQRIPTNSAADGPKWVCDIHRLREKKDCLIYSFGSNGNKDFEQGIRDEVGENCDIHTFDVIGRNQFKGDFTEILKGLSTFHKWGLCASEDKRSNGRHGRHKIEFKSLAETMEALGHTGRTIDIFKIDCEWCEWFTYTDWLKADILQILVETHNAPMPQARDFFYQLHDEGYVIFSKEANYINKGGGVEFAFLKLSKDFFINGTTYNNIMNKTKTAQEI